MSLRRDLDAAWGTLVKGHGFRKSRGIHILPLAEDWLGWLGLTRASYNGAGPVDVAPVVGVRWKPHQEIFRELNPHLPKSTSPTLTRPLATLVPPDYQSAQYNRAQWRVRTEKGEPFRLEETLDAVVLWGIPFMESLCDAEGAVDRLRPLSRFSPHPGLDWETYPIALVLTGREDEAVDFVREHLRDVADKPDMASKSYVDYAGRFLEKYS